MIRQAKNGTSRRIALQFTLDKPSQYGAGKSPMMQDHSYWNPITDVYSLNQSFGNFILEI